MSAVATLQGRFGPGEILFTINGRQFSGIISATRPGVDPEGKQTLEVEFANVRELLPADAHCSCPHCSADLIDVTELQHRQRLWICKGVAAHFWYRPLEDRESAMPGQPPMAPKAINPDPQPGETWEHADGGSLYVVECQGNLVRVQRRPLGDSEAVPFWIRRNTFALLTTGRLRGWA